MRKERIKTERNMFAVDSAQADPMNKDIPVVIVDDVITTGSTMFFAIQALHTAGFKNVRGISVAH